MNEITNELKQSEEAKRERNWDAKQRWLALQATITWAEQQESVRQKYASAARKQEERERLSGQRQLKQFQSPQEPQP